MCALGTSQIASHRIRERLDRRKPSAALRIFIWAFLARAVVGILAYLLTVETNVPFLEDALWYEEQGYSLAQEWLSGRWDALDTTPSGVQMAKPLISVIAGFYYVTGGTRSVLVLLIVYGALTAIIPVYVYWISTELGAPERARRVAALLVALSPAFVLFSGSLHKEGLVLLTLSVAVYHALRLQVRWQGRSFVALVLSVLVLLALRYYIAIVVCGAVAVGLVSARAVDRQTISTRLTMAMLIRQAVLVGAFVGLVWTLGFQEAVDRPLEESPEGLLVQVNDYRRELALAAQSGYLLQSDVSTLRGAAEFAPIGLLYFLAAPFPWQTGAFRQNLVIPETLFWVLLYPLAGLGVFRSIRVNRPGTVMLMATAGGMCVVYALMSGNIGIAYRMRTQVWLLLAPFAGWGWEAWREHRRWGRAVQRGRRSPVVSTRSR
jgi:hypothetical protein